jgi:DNA polymerase III alpha subunit
VRVRIAGAVIARQRPGTAKGFVFLSLEDETGIANAILTPQVFRENRLVVVEQQFLVIEGQLQNQQGAISVKAESVWPLSIVRVDAAIARLSLTPGEMRPHRASRSRRRLGGSGIPIRQIARRPSKTLPLPICRDR